MPSTYTALLRLEDQANGENDTTWGNIADSNFLMVEHAIAGRAAVTHDDTANYTLTTANNSADEARRMILNIGGALTAARNTVCPTSSKVYVAKNATTGGYATTLKTTAGTGISIPNGKTTLLFCDGTNVVDAIDYLSTLTVGSGLTVSAGSVTITGTGPHAIGAATDARVQLTIGGAFTGSNHTHSMWTSSSLTGTAGNNITGHYLNPTLIEAGSGVHAILAGLLVEPVITNGAATATDAAGIIIRTFAAGAGTTNATGLKIDSAPTAATTNRSLWVAAGSVEITGAGPHSLGGALSAQQQVGISGTFVSTNNLYGLTISSRIQGADGTDGALLYVNGTLDIGGSGTNGNFSGALFSPPTITAGAAALTNASTVKITAAPTGAANNYALWVDAGSVRIDGTTGAGAAAGTLANAPSAGDPDKWIPINSDGTQYWFPAWAA